MRIKAPLWEASEIEKRIIHFAEGLLVFDKPYDWPTSGHHLEDDDCVQYHLIQYLRKRGALLPTSKHPEGMVWTVHQLDADTSGLCLFVTEKNLVRKFHEAITADDADKIYLGIVNGTTSWDSHLETSPIGKIPPNSRGVLSIEDGGKTAHTEFTVLRRDQKSTHLSIKLRTGRTHQIRIHLEHLGHALLGEMWYCKTPCKTHFRQALHAHFMKFSVANTEYEFRSKLAEDLVKIKVEK